MPTPTSLVSELQKLSYTQQVEFLNEYFNHENTDLQCIIESWCTTTDMIGNNADIVDGIEDQLDICSRANVLIDALMKEVER